jgi:hypothetical protein
MEQQVVSDLRMDAYGYSFHATGVREIDEILSAVATAGKGYHHTEDWNEPHRDGVTEAQRIQAAANKAAERWRALSATPEPK